MFLLPLKKAYSLLSGIKGILAKTADGADPIFGNVLPDCAGGYAVVGVADLRVIDIAADIADIFHVQILLYSQPLSRSERTAMILSWQPPQPVEQLVSF